MRVGWFVVAAGASAMDCRNELCQAVGDPTFVLGVGEDELTLVNGDIPLLQGAQGGIHVPLAMRITGLDGRELLVAEIEGRIADEPVAASQPWLNTRCGDLGLEATNVLLIFDADPSMIDGQAVVIDAVVRDIDQREVSASIAGTLRYGG
jgi:hypothetical protein